MYMTVPFVQIHSSHVVRICLTDQAREMKRGALLLTIFLVQLVQGDDLYWRPNSNWNNPSNWKLGRVPCGNDIATIPEASMVYVNEDATFQAIILSDNGEVILGANVAINLSEDPQCGGDGIDSNPAPTSVPGSVNEFIGATPRYWECSDNWITDDMFPAEHPPCGEDNAIFEEDSYFHFVRANETISVRSLQVRGRQINSQNELDSNEFKLDINIIPGCGGDPSLCPCPSDQGCIKPTTADSPMTTDGPGVSVPQTGMPVGAIVGIVVGLLIGLLLIAIVIIIVIIVIVMYKKKGIGYKKDDFLEYEEQGQPKTSLPEPNSRNFDNPVYESTTLTPGEVQLTSSQEKPKLDFKGSNSDLTPDVDAYETVEYIKPGEEDFVKVDLGAVEEATEVPPTSGVYEPSSGVDSEMVEENGKKKKGKKSGNYERF